MTIAANTTAYVGTMQITQQVPLLIGIIILAALACLLLFLYQPVYNWLRTRAAWLLTTWNYFVWGIGTTAILGTVVGLTYFVFAEPASRGDTGNFVIIGYLVVAYFVIAGIGWIGKKAYDALQEREKQYSKVKP